MFQSASVDLSGSMPALNNPKFASSCGSCIIPILPAYLGSHRASMLVIGSLTYLVFHAMPVMPDAHGTLYRLPGSKVSCMNLRRAYFLKFGIMLWSSGITSCSSTRSVNSNPSVITIRS